MQDSSQQPPRRDTQRVLNEAWPLRDRNGSHARGILDRDPIDVEVRIVWSHDGEEWIAGQATRWTTSHVFVRVRDPRLLVPHVWVRAGDVRRV